MKNGALTWEWNGVSICLYTAQYDPVFGVAARFIDEPLEVTTPAQLVACLKANSEALTAAQWVEVLAALPDELLVRIEKSCTLPDENALRALAAKGVW